MEVHRKGNAMNLTEKNAILKKITLRFFLMIGISSLRAQIITTKSVIDIDDNVYKTVIIGHYEWMAENLKVTTYNNGNKISNITGSIDWTKLNSGAYCWYNNDESNSAIYGALYNWYAVNTGNLCPDGWRVPTFKDWKDLEAYVDTEFGVGDTTWDETGLKGFDVALGLKSNSGWEKSGNGLNRFGFSALPGGERLSGDGRFFLLGFNGFWWTGNEDTINDGKAIYRSLIYAFDQMMRYSHDKTFGFSVRCIRNK